MSSSRMVWLDALRLIAGVSMVGLHASADSMGRPWVDWPVDDRIWPLLIRAIVYTARTELFLIISLFLLALALERRPRSYGAVIEEQFRRLVIPFLTWSLFFVAFTAIKAQFFGYSAWYLEQLRDPMTWVEFAMLGTAKYHLHFIPTLFGMILAYPLFMLARSRPWLGMVVLVCLVFKREVDLFLWSELKGIFGFDFLVRAVKIFTYLGYGCVGAAAAGMLSRPAMMDQMRRLVPWIIWACVAMFSIKLISVHKTVELARWPHNYTAGYWADFLMPVMLFLLCMALSHKRWPAFLSKWAPYSFGIYLCHPIFLDLTEIGLAGLDWTPLGQVLTKIGVGILGTSALVVALSRTRAMAWTVGLGPLPPFLNFRFVKENAP